MELGLSPFVLAPNVIKVLFLVFEDKDAVSPSCATPAYLMLAHMCEPLLTVAVKGVSLIAIFEQADIRIQVVFDMSSIIR